MSEQTIICGLTQDAIDKLKKKHGALMVVNLKDKSGARFQAICREPDETVLKAFTAVGKTDEVAGGMILFDNCCLACDDDVKKRLPLKMKVIKAISDSLQQVEDEVKNL